MVLMKGKGGKGLGKGGGIEMEFCNVDSLPSLLECYVTIINNLDLFYKFTLNGNKRTLQVLRN